MQPLLLRRSPRKVMRSGSTRTSDRSSATSSWAWSWDCWPRLLVPGRDPIGLLGTLVIGVVGAVLGGWLAGAFFRETEGVDWLASIGVAMLLILLVSSGSRRRAWR